MNNYIVTINDSKKEVKVLDQNRIIFDGNELKVSVSKVSKHLYLIKIGNKAFELTTNKLSNETYSFLIDGNYYEASVRTTLREKAYEYLKNKERLTHSDEIKAPMPGLVLKIKKHVGDEVKIGESLVTLEAMKMENDLRSPASGIITEIKAEEGQSVEKGEIILKIE
ncbi:MAG: hypothetical protein PVH88_10015 [Ignavibacteria bacterium]|jgi:biotin carboxyl carrier protein